MTPKIFLPVTGFLLFLLTSLVMTQTAMANPFGEAFGYISNYSRMFNTGRSYRASRRRRAIRRRIARRHYAMRRRYYARRRRAAIHARHRNLRARSIRRTRLRRNIAARKRARLARRQLIQRRQSRVVKRRIAQQQRSRKQAQKRAQKQSRQVVARQRQARRYRQLAAQRNIHKKKNIAARSKSRRLALASVKSVAKRPVTRRVQTQKTVRPKQPSHKRQLLEQARGRSTYGVQDQVPALVRSEKKGVQLALSQAGFYHGAADGLFGSQTRRAIRDYQKSLGQDSTGHLGSVQLSSLLQAVSRNAQSGNSYLPQDDQKSDRQKKIKKQARLLAGSKQLPVNDKDVFEPKKVSFSKPSISRKARPFIAVKPRKLEQQASLQASGTKNVGSLPAQPLQNELKKTDVTPVDPKAALRVDYVHTLGRTRDGEALWVVKCMDKKQLRLYFWRDKQWWVRGKDGGSVGFSEYGKGGINNLAGKVCSL